jgi:hypothetical protein
MGIHPPAEMCTMPTIKTLSLVIPPGPTLQAVSGAAVERATCIDISGYISSSYIGAKNKWSYRKKSFNDASNFFHESSQSDFILSMRLVPEQYLAFPQCVPRPLRCDQVLS